MIPINAGERLPVCPSRCPDGIWTFYNERASIVSGETRECLESFPALDFAGEPNTIPAGAWLTDVNLGPRTADNPHEEASLAAFHFEGRVYFVSAHELLQKTKLIKN
jgi:hypothetical protein